VSEKSGANSSWLFYKLMSLIPEVTLSLFWADSGLILTKAVSDGAKKVDNINLLWKNNIILQK
jgi:hypothetical protein